jgi:hypothetical protein
MTITVVNLIPSKFAEAAATGQYTAIARKAVIDKFTATNTGASDVTFSIHLVPNGGTAGTGNQILRTRTIAPNECYTCPEVVGHSLEAGGFIATNCSTASVLIIRCTGREIT